MNPNKDQYIDNELLVYSALKKYNITHFTTTVQGGVSKGRYSSMNMSFYSKDNEFDVLQNRKNLAEKVGVDVQKLFVPYQTHQDKVYVIDEKFLKLSSDEQDIELRGVDALITCERNICIGITTADCVPILIYDPVNHVLACVHAGWKGTVARIGAMAMQQMHKTFRSEYGKLLVSIGPSICQEIFEVGDEVGDAFAEAGFNLSSISYRNQESGKLHIDLWQANREQLLHLGVNDDNIHCAELCTYKNSNMFFSARRQGFESGRMLTGGVLK